VGKPTRRQNQSQNQIVRRTILVLAVVFHLRTIESSPNALCRNPRSGLCTAAPASARRLSSSRMSILLARFRGDERVTSRMAD
jgi:hypothetical protein